ncbi:hypothetical protein C6P44_001980 [Monosporozyma unispora]|nr:hypothetical protein C6P44_001980 [Kazachstania unispora]
MVLYKRKPIVLPDPKPLPPNIDVFVWHIDETGEWFQTYEEYLERLDFYTRHHFTCEITGASCLTFFEALDSEESQFKYVEEKFPLKLREPVARYLHFNTVRRLDGLVEKVYSKFKTDFFPGETVYLRKNKDNNENSTTSSQQGTPQPPILSQSNSSTSLSDSHPHYQRPYIIKEKVQFNAIVNPVTKEVIAPGHAKYMLVEDESPNTNASSVPNKSFVADESQIYRDRSTFTKHLIKCFFKITLQRASTKMGAPWCVKPEYLQMYGLTMDWPIELLRFKDDEPTKEPAPVKNKSQMDENDTNSKNGNFSTIDFEDSSVTPSSFYNDSMKGHPSDETTKKSKNGRKRKDKSNNESSPEDEEDGMSSKSNKKRRMDTGSEMITESELDSRASSNAPEVSTPVVLRSIVNDMDIPYRGKPTAFLSDLSYYNKALECVPLMSEKTLNKSTLPNFDKLLQIYQFVNTFNEKLCISYFNFDQFITTLKCTDPLESQGEVVNVTLLNEKNSNDKDEMNDIESQWQRNPKIRKMIGDKNIIDKDLKYTITSDEPAADDIIDNFNSNGSGLIIEIFVALLRLFINENGDWKIVIMEEWIPEPITVHEQELGVTPKGIHDVKNEVNSEVSQEEPSSNDAVTNNAKQENQATKQNGTADGESIETNNDEKPLADKEASKPKEALEDIEIINDDDDDESTETDEEFETLLDRILNFRNQEWTERLTKRQFNNGNWLIILLGIFEDSLAVPKYTEFLTYFKKTIITKDISMTQLPKALWRNFCRNFSIQEKITALWVLVDIISNFSPDIKNAIEASMEMCMHIRSDRFKIFKDIKAETTALSAIDKENDPEAFAAKEAQLQKLQDDKTDLDKKLMENDFQRLKPLGMDRYCNRYFWFDLTGVPNNSFSGDESEYHNGRLWVRGPNIHCIKKFLKLEEEQIARWTQVCEVEGNIIATKNVFGVYRTENGSYNFIDPISKEETELVSEEGQVNKSVNLTPIQRKIIDETPECLLLDHNKWYYIENNEYLDSFIEWLDIWGRREHDLLRQFKPIIERLKDVISIRNQCQQVELNEKELDYVKEFEEYTLSANELNVEKSTNTDDSTSQAEKEEDNELDEIDNKLERIVDEIMNLDDGSKTRKVLNAISELENKRDLLLEKKEELLAGSGPGGRIVARAEKNRIRHSRDNKLTRQGEILSSLINLRHFNDIDNVISWKNQTSIEAFGSELRKNANKAKRGSQRKK